MTSEKIQEGTPLKEFPLIVSDIKVLMRSITARDFTLKLLTLVKDITKIFEFNERDIVQVTISANKFIIEYNILTSINRQISGGISTDFAAVRLEFSSPEQNHWEIIAYLNNDPSIVMSSSAMFEAVALLKEFYQDIGNDGESMSEVSPAPMSRLPVGEFERVSMFHPDTERTVILFSPGEVIPALKNIPGAAKPLAVAVRYIDGNYISNGSGDALDIPSGTIWMESPLQ